MSCATCGYKTCVIFLALLQLAIAVILMATGIFMFAEFTDIQEFSKGYMAPATITLCSGIFLVILAVLGICGACKENKWILSVFFVVSGALFLLELIGACLALSMRGELESALQHQFETFMNQSSTVPTYQKELDWMQMTWGCCGSTNYTDWLKLNETIPVSCCQYKNSSVTECTASYLKQNNLDQGCFSLLHERFFSNLNAVGGVTLAFAFVQLMALAGVIFLVCRKQHHYEVF